jgi:hypothetical protein
MSVEASILTGHRFCLRSGNNRNGPIQFIDSQFITSQNLLIARCPFIIFYQRIENSQANYQVHNCTEFITPAEPVVKRNLT